MHLAHLRLRDFRNYSRLDQTFTPGFHLFLGQNAQGKTNLLEAIYLLATLRSFRGVGGAQMIRHQHKAYYVGASVVSQITHEIKIYWSVDERRVSVNGNVIRRLSDFFGMVRAVVFCTDDLQLIKGPARMRRRFIDLILAQTNPAYLPLLQRYSQALRARNAILKKNTPDEALLESFTTELVQSGTELIRLRQALVPQFSPVAQAAFERIVAGSEILKIQYHPAVSGDFAVQLAQSRQRELHYRSTLIGPHRDELLLALDERSAAKYASEGQKRSIAIALKMAQAEFLTQFHGVPPILLIDDVLGELDRSRRQAFLPLLLKVHGGRSQVFMTATDAAWTAELDEEVKVWNVSHGSLKPSSPV